MTPEQQIRRVRKYLHKVMLRPLAKELSDPPEKKNGTSMSEGWLRHLREGRIKEPSYIKLSRLVIWMEERKGKRI